MSKKSLWKFYAALFALELLIVFFVVIPDYAHCLMHPELPILYIPKFMKTGVTLTVDDFRNIFNSFLFDVNPRPRFLSNLVLLTNEKFRLWLFQWVAPHPSLSLSWIATLVLSPYFLYKFIYQMTSNKAAGWIAVALAYLSTGSLSGVTFLFHPGKPLTVFMAILCLYWSSKIHTDIIRNGEYLKKNYIQFAVLLGLLWISFFLDEVALFLFIIIPVMFSEIFSAGRTRVWIRTSYGSLLIAYLGFITWGVPFITRRLGFGDFAFWNFAIGSNDGLQAEAHSLFIPAFLYNLSYLLKNYFVFHSNSAIAWLLGVGVFFYLIYLARGFKREKNIVLRSAAVSVLYVAFLTLILTRHGQVVESSYYYASLFPVLMAIPVAILLSDLNRSAYAWAKPLVVLYLACISYGNFISTNNDWYDEHSLKYRDYLPSGMSDSGNPDYTLTKEFWLHRDDEAFMANNVQRLPIQSYWLTVELSLMRKR